MPLLPDDVDPSQKETIAPTPGVIKPESVQEGLQTFGKYTVIRELGRGGMAVVYEARDESLSRRIALKLLPLQYSSDPEFVQRFHREAQAAAGLEHPAIISVYDLGQQGDTHYIAMELVDGETLDYLKNDEGMTEERILDLCAQVADGLAHAHAHGIVHRDIKPSNIMVDRSGRARITDFGLARPEAAAKLTATGDIMGSPAYMSPEQARGDQVDHQSDIYSLGTVMYELLCGQPPFRADTTLELLKMVLDKIPPSPRKLNPEISAKLEAIILTAMEKDLKNRYADAGQLAADLKAYLLGEPVSVRPLRFFEKVDRFAKRHRVGLTFLVTLSLAVTVSHRFLSRFVSRIRHRAVLTKAENIGVARRLTGGHEIDLFSYADSLLKKGDHQHARTEYERILRTEHTPGNTAYAYLNIGRCRLAAGDAAEARDWYNKSAHAAGQNLPELRCRAFYALHKLEIDAGNIPAAQQQALAMHREKLSAPDVPAPVVLLRNLALDLRKNGMFHDALRMYRNAIRSSHTPWRSERLRLEVARTTAEKGDSTTAAARLELLLKDATSPDIRGAAAADAALLALMENRREDANGYARLIRKQSSHNAFPAYALLLADLLSNNTTPEDYQHQAEDLPVETRNDALLGLALLTNNEELLRTCAESGNGTEWPSRLAAEKLNRTTP